MARGLTNELGLLSLTAPRPGTYRIRIDRIGWTGMTTDSIVLGPGQSLRIVVPMPSERHQLPTLEVGAKSRCDATSQGGVLATALWEEIRKALFANLITQSRGTLPLHLKEFVREVSLQQEPLREWVAVSRIVRGKPFGSVSPAVLASQGFARAIGDSTEYAAPDAALLLSDEFVSTHCFRAVTGPGSLVGLAFTPIPSRKVPEIFGTMWVDRENSELRYLEYSYTPLPGVLQQAKLGGRVEFMRLPGGAWVVNSWYIRMPRLVTSTEYIKEHWREVTRLAGYLDRGGRAMVALNPNGRVDRAILRGHVYDSVAGKGLGGALVWVQGLSDSMYTDGDGGYEMAVALSGDQTVAVRHPKLGLLNEPTTRVTLLSLDDTTRVDFAVPPLARFIRTYCRNRNPPGTVSIVGLAFSANGTPAIDQQVGVVPRRGASNQTSGVSPMRTTPKGVYALCQVPAADTVRLVMSSGKLILAEAPIAMTGMSQWVDLREPPEDKRP